MAIIQLQEPFKSFRGRDARPGGQVLYPALRRNIARNFVQPANPQSGSQTFIRTLLTALSQAYSNVTDSLNVGWIELAKSLSHKDKDGNTVLGSAKAAYVKINFWLFLLGGTTSDTAPTYAAIPGLLVISAAGRTALGTGWQFTYTWDGNPTNLAIKATPPLPGLRRQPRPSDYRFATDDPADSIVAITNAGGVITILDTVSRFDYAVDDRISILAQTVADSGIPGSKYTQVETLVDFGP